MRFTHNRGELLPLVPGGKEGGREEERKGGKEEGKKEGRKEGGNIGTVFSIDMFLSQIGKGI
jgi:hypothetical protein